MRGQTKAQKVLDFSDAMQCLKQGKAPMRLGNRRKDGSLPTKPAIPIQYPKIEREVLADCLAYLKRKHWLANRLNNTTMMVKGQWNTFGIIGGGDIIGCTDDGRHFEVECKKGIGGLWTVGQQRRCKRVRDHKGLYYVVHDVQELDYFLETGDDSDSVTSECSVQDVAEEEGYWGDCLE